MARIKEFDEAAVLDKALKLFWNKGYNGTSAQELVTELGISRSSLYDTFGDKRSLFLKALKQYETNNTAVMVKMANESTDALKTIRQIFQTLLQDSILDTQNMGCFVVNTAIELSSHDPEIKEIISENLRLTEEAFFTVLKKGKKSNQINANIDPRSTARFLLNNVMGLKVSFRAGQSKKSIEDVIKLTLASLG
jgi:TetR/AcrR family transcriptional repressor of nem operon